MDQRPIENIPSAASSVPPRQPPVESGSPFPPAAASQETAPRPEGGARREQEPGAGWLPHWLRGGEEEDVGETAARGTLAESAERIASRWLLLNEILSLPEEALAAASSRSPGARRVPLLLVFSIAGGVGKTTLLATLGRALAAHGERVLLADAASLNLVPCYFGSRLAGAARGPVPAAGAVRTFSPPTGSSDAPVDAVTLDAGESGDPDPLRKALLDNSRKAHRILVDIQSASKAMAQRLLALGPLVLVPLLPDMNSVASLAAVEEAFAGRDDAGAPVKLFYLLNQFDPSLPLHVDVREVLGRQLGGRLLPLVLRRSPAVSEALAEGMTVIDYAPGSPAAEDYARLAEWLRGVAPPASRGLEQLRWSER